MKTCSRCKEQKPLPGFYADPRYADGYQGVCKDCQCEQQQARESMPHRRDTYRKYRSSEKGKQSRIACQKRYVKRHPEKVKAHSIVSYAKATGKLMPEPCEICGHVKSEGHHDDYSKPLTVRWLCKTHHDKHHKE